MSDTPSLLRGIQFEKVYHNAFREVCGGEEFEQSKGDRRFLKSMDDYQQRGYVAARFFSLPLDLGVLLYKTWLRKGNCPDDLPPPPAVRVESPSASKVADGNPVGNAVKSVLGAIEATALGAQECFVNGVDALHHNELARAAMMFGTAALGALLLAGVFARV